MNIDIKRDICTQYIQDHRNKGNMMELWTSVYTREREEREIHQY